MRIEHIALWTRDLERSREFYVRWFGARANTRYDSATTPGFASYFLTFPQGGARLELMTIPGLADAAADRTLGWVHIAVEVGSRDAVLALTERMRAAGVRVLSEPRHTGDGYFEAVVADPDGNEVELAAASA